MTPEELKALLQSAIADIEKQKTANDGLALQVKDLTGKLTNAIDAEKVDPQEIEDLKNEISDLRSKIKPPVAALTSDQQKDALRTMAVKSFNSYARAAKKGGSHAGMDLKGYLGSLADEFKTLNITTAAEGGSAVASILSMDLIEYGREYSPILSMIGMKNGLTRDYTELVLISYPSVGDGIENVAGVTLSPTTEQTYAEVKSDVIKVYANPRLTDEALMGTDYDVYADLVRLIGDEIGIQLAYKALYGDGTAKNGRGILSSSRVDITIGTGESFKPTIGAGARDNNFFPVSPTGVSGGLGADSDATMDFFTELEAMLPTKYLNTARFCMNRKTRAVLKKVRNADGDPLLIGSYKDGGSTTILGYPVVIDDTLPDIDVDSTPIIFGDLSRAFAMSNGDIDYMQSNPYKIQGVTILEYNKEIFTIMQASDAVLVIACTTNSGA